MVIYLDRVFSHIQTRNYTTEYLVCLQSQLDKFSDYNQNIAQLYGCGLFLRQRPSKFILILPGLPCSRFTVELAAREHSCSSLTSTQYLTPDHH
jgi:hypothetical protein